MEEERERGRERGREKENKRGFCINIAPFTISLGVSCFNELLLLCPVEQGFLREPYAA